MVRRQGKKGYKGEVTEKSKECLIFGHDVVGRVDDNGVIKQIKGI